MKGYFFLLGNGNSTTSISNKMFANSLINCGYNIEIIYDLEEKFNILNNCDADIIFFQKTIQCPAHISKNLSQLSALFNRSSCFLLLVYTGKYDIQAKVCFFLKIF